MASYGALLRMIPTSEINRLLRDEHYTRWAYFIDDEAIKVGVVFANDERFGAYTVADEPDPKLHPYGLEAITDLECVPDPQLLIVSAGGHELRAAVFNNVMTVQDDDFLPHFTYDAALDWQKFLAAHRVAVAVNSSLGRGKRVFFAVIAALIVLVLAVVVLG
jgi:hypothetical protein